MGWSGPTERTLELADVQRLLDERGGIVERRAPVARLGLDGANIVEAYSENGGHLADIAWRPHDPRYTATAGLFLC